MSDTPAVTVLMSVHNGARHLYAAVQSILAQDFTDFEFLIVNDGSTDNSGAILHDLAARDSRIHLIDREHRGLAASLNEMIAMARSPLLARMGCDDISMPRRFSKQVEFLNTHPDVDIAGTAAHLIDEDGAVIAAKAEQIDSRANLHDALQDGPHVCTPSAMMRSAIVRKLGGYRPAFRYAEDYDLWLRASRESGIVCTADALQLCRRGPNQLHEQNRSERSWAAATAWYAHQRVLEGRPDPFDDLGAIPPVDEIDALFRIQGAALAIGRITAWQMRHAPTLPAVDYGLEARRHKDTRNPQHAALKSVNNARVLSALALGTALLALESCRPL